VHNSWEETAPFESVVAIAEAADRLGYHHITCSEHVAVPAGEIRRGVARATTTRSQPSVISRRAHFVRFETHVLVLATTTRSRSPKRYEAHEGRARREITEGCERVVVARATPRRDLARGNRDMLAARDVVVAEPVGGFGDRDDRLERRGLLPRVVHRGFSVRTGVMSPSFTPASLPGQLDRLLADDVLLHLGRAGTDGGVALEHVQTVPRATVDRVGSALRQDRGRAEQIAREIGQRLREVAPTATWPVGPRASSARP